MSLADPSFVTSTMNAAGTPLPDSTCRPYICSRMDVVIDVTNSDGRFKSFTIFVAIVKGSNPSIPDVFTS